MLNPPRSDAETIGGRFDPAANSFDLMRLFLAVVVIFSHCFALLGRADEPIATFLHYGSGGELAVDGFLVISGFLVTRSIRARDFDTYVLSRVARIVPGLALVTLVEVFVIGPVFSSARLWTFLTYVGFRHLENIAVFGLDSRMYSVFPNTNPPWMMNGSLWTIPIECSFYIILPIITAFGGFRYVSTFLLIGSVIAFPIVGQFGYGPDNPGPSLFTNVHLFNFVDLSSYFLFGAMAWFLRDRIPYSKGLLALCGIGLFAAAGVGLAPEALKIFFPYLILYACVSNDLGSRLKRRIGDLSYGIYLAGFPITLSLIAITDGHITVYALFGGVMVLSGIYAWLSWHLVERPCLRLRRRPKA